MTTCNDDDGVLARDALGSAAMIPGAPPAASASRIPAPILAALWMVVSCAFFAVLNVLVRHLSFDMHPFEIAFFRNGFGLIFVLPWLVRRGLPGVGTQRMGMHVVRALVSLAAMLCWFTAVSLMPIAEVTALSFTAPLFATVGAALFLGEVVRLRRWAATVIGFAGAVVIIRPGFETIDYPTGLALASAGFMSISVLLVKSLCRTERPAVIVFYMTSLMTPMSLVPALFVWDWPQPLTWVWLAAMGLGATLAHLALNRAFGLADISAVLPFDFFRLVFVAILGLAFFDERPDMWMWIGAAVIFCATLYIAHREAAVAKVPPEQSVAKPAIDGGGPAALGPDREALPQSASAAAAGKGRK